MMLYFIILFVIACILAIVLLLYVREKNRSKYYENLLIKILNNDDIIKESLSTIATAYGVEEGDLMNWISKRSKQK